MQVLKGHRRVVQSVCFSPDGKLLASGSGDRTIRVWDLSTNEVRFKWEPHGVMGNRVRFAPDGRWLAAVDNHRVRVYDLKTGEQSAVLGENVPAGFIQDVTFSPDSMLFVGGGIGGKMNRWRIWATDDWREVPASELAAKNGHVHNLAFNSDGTTLVVNGGSGLLGCDTKKWKTRCSFPERTRGSAVQVTALSPDDRFVCYGCGPVLAVCDLMDGKEVATLDLGKKHFLDAAFSRSGTFLATVSNEETVKCWDPTTWKSGKEFAWGIGKLKCIAFDTDGLRAAAGSDKGQIVVWDIDE